MLEHSHAEGGILFLMVLWYGIALLSLQHVNVYNEIVKPLTDKDIFERSASIFRCWSETCLISDQKQLRFSPPFETCSGSLLR